MSFGESWVKKKTKKVELDELFWFLICSGAFRVWTAELGLKEDQKVWAVSEFRVKVRWSEGQFLLFSTL